MVVEEVFEGYQGVPIFDEDPSEDEEWQDQKLILTTLVEIPTKGPLHYTGLGQGKPYKVFIDEGVP